MIELKEKLLQAAQAIKAADALFITAGSEMCIASGLSDFRSNAGFWKAYPSIARLGKSYNEIVNPLWFDRNPKFAWAFYGHRLNLNEEMQPHSGFKLLIDLIRQKEYGCFVFTSNVDGQFQKAGFDDSFIEECHGSIQHFQCVKPCSSEIWDGSKSKVEVDLERFEAKEPLPHCKNCGSIARPNILMFNDWTWLSHRSVEQGDRLNLWLETMADLQAKVAIVELGAGHDIPTIRLKSQRVFRSHKASFIRINQSHYDVPDGAIGLPFGAKEGLERIFELM